jgi:hypothetical protein
MHKIKGNHVSNCSDEAKIKKKDSHPEMCNRKTCLVYDYDYDWIIQKKSDYDYDYDWL